MRLSDFDYHLPPERIAQEPLEQRDAARLLIDRGAKPPGDGHVGDLCSQLRRGDLLVLNDTKVIPARLQLRRITGGKAEVLLLEPRDHERVRWEALVRPAKKLQVDERLVDGDGNEIVRIGRRTAAGDTFEVALLADAANVDETLAAVGEMPLPPYITRPLDEPNRYQTVFAREPASAAAPTAGLHFTVELLDELAQRGVAHTSVELVVGLDTFRPVSVDDPSDHQMHTERYAVRPEVMEQCLATRRAGGRIVSVGTTSVRALESAATRGELTGRTDLFIRRGYEWKLVDMLITNFHLPRTTLLMMIDAFVGERWRRLYDHALASDGLDPPYRFLSFGDAMLLRRDR